MTNAKQMRRNRARLWAGLGALLLLALVFAFWPRPVEVDMQVAARGPMSVTIDEEGRTRVRDVYVVSAPITGRIQRVEIEAGDEVMRDETVLTSLLPLDPGLLDRRTREQLEAAVGAANAAVQLAEAEVERAQAELTFANGELERARRLRANGTISAQALERAELEMEQSRAALAAAEAALVLRVSELANAEAALIEPMEGADPTEAACCVAVRSPVSGRVLRLMQESERVVSMGAPLIEIGDPTELEVVVDLLSTDAVKVAPGDPAVIVDWGGGEALAAEVRRVEPFGFTKVSALGIEEQRVNVILDFVAPAEAWSRLGHGYRVEARIEIWRGDGVIKAPLSALFREDGEWAAFVDERGRARLRHLQIGRLNAFEASVDAGLSEGERLILHPPERVRDGVGVRARDMG